MPSNSNSAASEVFGQVFCQAMTEALTESCNRAWQVTLAEGSGDLCPPDEAGVSFRFRFGGGLDGDAFLIVKQTDTSLLEMRDVSAETGTTQETHVAALGGILDRSLSRMTGMLEQHYGELTISVGQGDEGANPDDGAMELWARTEAEVPCVSFYLYLNPQLIHRIQTVSVTPFAYPPASVQASAANLEMVMDVELNVTLRFGRRRLALREVLELTSGSVVELDRQVDEPVDLILDGRVIARGEAVIIDGNYGLRVSQVLQPLDGISRFV